MSEMYISPAAIENDTMDHSEEKSACVVPVLRSEMHAPIHTHACIY